MHAAVRPYVAAGAALVGSSVIAATPVVATPPDIEVANPAVRLAADSIANVPVNLFYALVNVPAYEVEALNHWADAVEAGGSWWLKTPTNVWGWDPGNPPMLQALVAVLVPFPVISGHGGLPEGITPNGEGPLGAGPSEEITSENSILGGSAKPGTLGYMLNVLVAAEMPMHEGCGFTCPNLIETAQGYFRVPLSALAAGYQFGEVIDTNDPGYPVAWSGQQAAPLNPLEPFTNFWNSLTADPSDPTSQAYQGIKPVTFDDLVHVGTRLYDSGIVAFSPWFKGSYLFTGFPFYDIPENVLGWIAGLTELVCPACNVPSPPAVDTIPSPDARTVTIDAAPQTTVTAKQLPDTTETRIAQTPPLGRGVLTRTTHALRQLAPSAPVAPTPPEIEQPEQQPVSGSVPEVATSPPAQNSAPRKGTWSSPAGRDGNGAQFGQGSGRTSGSRLSGVVKSVTERVQSSVSKIADRNSGGTKKAATTGEGSADTGESGE